jgi:hypothetical protein
VTIIVPDETLQVGWVKATVGAEGIAVLLIETEVENIQPFASFTAIE